MNLHSSSLTISASLHIAIFSLLLLLGQYSVSAKNNSFYVPKTDSINIEILSSQKFAKISSETPQNIEPKVESLTLEKAKHTPTKNAFTAKIPSKAISAKPDKSSSKYEQLLSRHFSTQILQLSKNLIQTDNIYIWVKVDRLGNIRDYGFQPKDLGNELIDQLESVVALSNPVPTPPDYPNGKSVRQYLIPIKFG